MGPLDPTPGLVLLVLALVFLLMLAGRMITTHNHAASTYTTPFHCLLVGCGLWYLWVLVFGAAIGASLKITWWLFLAVILALLFGLTRAFRGVANIEHFWTKIVTTALLLSPAIWWAGSDLPTLYDEFWYSLKNIDHLLHLGTFYTAETIQQFGIAQAKEPLAASLTTLPVHLLGGTFIPASAALFNLILLAAAAGGLTQAADIRVRWSNLPWVASGALLAITLFNPFFQSSTVLSGTFDLPLAIALFGFAFPLLRREALPTGWGALPTACIGIWLIGQTSFAWLYVAAIGVLWLIRSFIENPTPTLKALFSWVLVGGLPAIAWTLWQFKVRHTPLFNLNGATNWDVGAGYATALLMQPLAWLLVIVILAAAVRSVLKNLAPSQTAKLFTEYAWFVVPAILLVFSAGITLCYGEALAQVYGSAQVGVWRLLASLQFILLLPLWVVYKKWYFHSPLKTFAFKSPWVAGLICGALVIMVQLGNERRFKPTVQAPLSHTLQVAASLKENYVEWGEKVAVVDSLKTGNFYSAVMAFGLRNHATVQPVTSWLGQADGRQAALHQALVEQGFSHVWLHAPDDISRRLFHSQLRPDRSYLFELAHDHIKLVASYPHLRYTEPHL